MYMKHDNVIDDVIKLNDYIFIFFLITLILSYNVEKTFFFKKSQSVSSSIYRQCMNYRDTYYNVIVMSNGIEQPNILSNKDFFFKMVVI